MTRVETRRYGLILSVLAFLFFLRVLGQALVNFFDVRGLPAMAEWYSGLLAYPVLLPTQLAILTVLFDGGLVSSSVDLGALLDLGDGKAHLGFTGSTGGATERVRIINWFYNSEGAAGAAVP